VLKNALPAALPLRDRNRRRGCNPLILLLKEVVYNEVTLGTVARKAIGQDFASADKLQEQQICMEQIEEAEAMLKKKFKSMPKASCTSRYKAEVLNDME
jgi:hypothetical protein